MNRIQQFMSWFFVLFIVALTGCSSAIQAGRLGHRRLDIDPAEPVADLIERLKLKQGDALKGAAIQLFGKEPQRLVLQSEVRCVRFKGKDTSSFVDTKALAGTVIDQIDNAEKFVMNHIRLSAEIKDFYGFNSRHYLLIERHLHWSQSNGVVLRSSNLAGAGHPDRA